MLSAITFHSYYSHVVLKTILVCILLAIILIASRRGLVFHGMMLILGSLMMGFGLFMTDSAWLIVYCLCCVVGFLIADLVDYREAKQEGRVSAAYITLCVVAYLPVAIASYYQIKHLVVVTL